MMLVSRGAREKTRTRLTRVSEVVPELDGLHGEQQRTIEVRFLERERGDAPSLLRPWRVRPRGSPGTPRSGPP